jgi:hypothetical protein
VVLSECWILRELGEIVRCIAFGDSLRAVPKALTGIVRHKKGWNHPAFFVTAINQQLVKHRDLFYRLYCHHYHRQHPGLQAVLVAVLAPALLLATSLALKQECMTLVGFPK